jgi:hypothetical protein
LEEVGMPWKECSVMDERLQFVARRLAGEPMAELCRGFGIQIQSAPEFCREIHPQAKVRQI